MYRHELGVWGVHPPPPPRQFQPCSYCSCVAEAGEVERLAPIPAFHTSFPDLTAKRLATFFYTFAKLVIQKRRKNQHLLLRDTLCRSCKPKWPYIMIWFTAVGVTLTALEMISQ